jgi:hypothetical protein
MAVRFIAIMGLIVGVLCFPAAVLAADSTTLAAVQARFARDTIFHVALNVAGGRASIFYGDIPLVGCMVKPPDPEAATDFTTAWNRRRTTGWQNVTRRYVWSGGQAVSDTVIGVIARVSSVNPDLIRRVMPRRFDVLLTQNLCLRIMTPEGAGASRPFYEKWRMWAARLNPFDHRETLDLVVSPLDAQMLYYALEPGSPVLLVGGTGSRPAR